MPRLTGTPRARLLLLAVALLGLAALAAAARGALARTEGLRAQYVAVPQRGGQVRHLLDREISTDAMTRAWGGAPPARFQAHWSGFLVIERAGTYTIATISDDGSTVRIDGRLVVDNGGEHGPRLSSGKVRLLPGAHAISIDYAQGGGGYDLQLRWARNGAPLTAMPAWVLWSKRVPSWRALAARVLDPLPMIALVVFGLVASWVTAREAGSPVMGVILGWVRRPVVSRVLLVAGSFAFAVIAAELVVQAVFRHVRSSGDARTYFAARAPAVRSNSLGYRDPEVTASNPHRYRIIVIGDSITWGQGLAEDQRFTNVLQQSLGPGVEVLNFGYPGHNMPEHLQALDRALPLAPDFVLLQLYTNDFELGTMARPRALPLLPWRSVDAWLLRSSALYTLLAAQWPQLQVQAGITESYEHYMYRYLGDPRSPTSREAFGMLRTFVGRVRAAGAASGAVMFPNPGVYDEGRRYAFDYLHDRVREICASEHVQCVDLRRPFAARFHSLGEIVVSPFDGHPSARAHRVAAEAVLAAFRSSWRAHKKLPSHTKLARGVRGTGLMHRVDHRAAPRG